MSILFIFTRWHSEESYAVSREAPLVYASRGTSPGCLTKTAELLVN